MAHSHIYIYTWNLILKSEFAISILNLDSLLYEIGGVDVYDVIAEHEFI